MGIPNCTQTDGDRKRNLFVYESDELDLRALDWQSEVNWMGTKFSASILKLREAYQSVETKWGLLIYFV